MTALSSDASREVTKKSAATSKETQVRVVSKLLASKGRAGAEEIRQRLLQGRSIIVRSIEFGPEVLKEALQRWEEASCQKEPMRMPAMPASWGEPASSSTIAGTRGEPKRANLQDQQAEVATSSSRLSEVPAASSKLKRKPNSHAEQGHDVFQSRPPASPASSRVHREPGSGGRGSDFQNFMEASRRRTLGGTTSSGLGTSAQHGTGRLPHTSSPHVEEQPSAGDCNAGVPGKGTAAADGFLTRTATEISATRRTSSAGDQVPGLPGRRLAQQETVRLPVHKRSVQSLSPDLVQSPPSKRRLLGSPAEKVEQQPFEPDRNGTEKMGATTAEPAPEPSPCTEAAGLSGSSVKALKALLADNSVDFTGCVEKAELQELWQRFAQLRSQPLEKLQAACAAAGGPLSLSDATACARFLVSEKTKQLPQQQPHKAPQAAEAPPRPRAAEMPQRVQQFAACGTRDREAQDEVLRIFSLRREAFRQSSDWAFAVLQASRDASGVQRSYRALMRKLHPDKVTQSDRVEKAIELIREAKEMCERSLSKVEVPCPPRSLRYEILESKPGRRRYRLCWSTPEWRPSAPVTRYLVAALDPAYGKALTITVLEPDYSEELKRFVSVDELTSFVLAEEDLQKMPSLWKQSRATVQIAAANEAGQSAWAKLEVSLVGGASRPSLGSTASPQSSHSSYSCDSASDSSPRDSPQKKDDMSFELDLRGRSGPELRSWLHRQLKAPLVSWLKTLRMPTTGTKEDLIDRVLDVMGCRER